mmetsp:Transcript_64136/g.134852  ORF Transcript_64136/g.134852 Transcript_64136/m.134852 type:complete len:91 (+) Transcript_64136:147-419(+)
MANLTQLTTFAGRLPIQIPSTCYDNAHARQHRITHSMSIFRNSASINLLTSSGTIADLGKITLHHNAPATMVRTSAPANASACAPSLTPV